MKSNLSKSIQKILVGLVILMIIITDNNCTTSSKNTIEELDVVILNGRVIDPESQFDEFMNIGISEGKIRIITKKTVSGKAIFVSEQ